MESGHLRRAACTPILASSTDFNERLPMDTHEITDFAEPLAMRLLVVAAAVFAGVTLLAAASAGESLSDPAWGQHVSKNCRSPECLSPRQFITVSQARSMKRDLGAIVLDIRMPTEPDDPPPHLAAD